MKVKQEHRIDNSVKSLEVATLSRQIVLYNSQKELNDQTQVGKSKQ